MTADVVALRAAAARLDAAQVELERTGRRLHGIARALDAQWRGTAAGAAAQELQGLVGRAALLAGGHAEAAAVLRTCAHALEDAQATLAKAELLEQQDAQRRRSATARGAFAGPYDDTGLLRYANSLRRAAHAQHDAACARAATALQELARPPASGLSGADQLAGVGTGAVDAVRGTADLLLGLLHDPRGTAGGVVEGLDHARSHPRDAAVAATGWDVLQQGRYGEWAGAFVPDLLTSVLSGGAVPAGRRAAKLAEDLRELADDADLPRRGPQAPPGRVGAGGPVLPRPGAVLHPRYPRRILDLSSERRTHITVGDPPPRTGGGHSFGAGRGKSEFPQGWSDDDIIRRVMDTARHPQTTAEQPTRPTLLAHAEHDGVCVRVVVDPGGEVVTAHPVTGAKAAAGCPTTRSR